MAETDAQLNEMYASTATSITELNQLFAEGAIGDSKFGTGDEVTAYEKQLNYLTTAAITSAESLDALYAAYDEGMANGATISYETMANALMGLAGQYGNCTEELNAFETALASGNESAMKKAQEQLEVSIMLGEAAEEYGLSAEEMEIQAAQMAKTYGLSQRAAAKLAIEN
jgi:hypothetical protein